MEICQNVPVLGGRNLYSQWPYHGNEFWQYSFLENSIPVHIRQVREGLDVLQLRKTFLGVQLEQLQRELKGRDETIPHSVEHG